MYSVKPKIVVKGLYKVFGKKPEVVFPLIKEGLSRKEIMHKTKQVVALRDINFEVYPGEIFVLMGLSGSGKSTLLRSINRLREITRGEVYVNGLSVYSLSSRELRSLRRKVFGMVFQRFALLPHKTVLENVTFGLDIQGFSKEVRIKKAKSALKVVGLEGWEKSKIKSLSGGMRQRVGLARALAIDPEILLMDEPFSALDPLVRNRMQDELLRLQKKMKKTIVFVTHDLNEAIKLGDRIGIINDQGLLVQIGTPEEILLNPSNDYVSSFIADVDRSTVIRVESVMDPVDNLFGSDDDMDFVLNKMQSKDINYAFMADVGKFKGLLVRGDVEAAVKDKRSLEDIIRRKKSVNLLDTIEDVLPQLIDSICPVAVVDDDGFLMGEITRAHISKIFKENGSG